VVRKGTNYLSFVTEDGKVHKAWLHEIELGEGVKDLPPHLRKLVKELDKKEKELEKKGLKVKTFVYNPDTGKPDIELDERNYRKEYDNYHARPEQREKNAARLRARRLMAKGGKVKKFDGLDVHHKDNNPLNNEEENLKVTTKKWNRTEPRLRSKEKLDEEEPPTWPPRWYKNVISKISRVTHPHGWDKIIQQYVIGMKDPEKRKHPGMWAATLAREYSGGIDGRQLIKYINKLVAMGQLPKELKAEYEIEEAKSPIQKLKDFDKIRVAAGKKPIFKDRDTIKFIKMKKKGQMTIMNVPSDEEDFWKKKGYVLVNNMSFKDFVHQIQERELTDTELKRREEIAKDLSDADFKKKYGTRWKEVKMGVATKMAKKESLKT
jgi:hypothetical protein